MTPEERRQQIRERFEQLQYYRPDDICWLLNEVEKFEKVNKRLNDELLKEKEANAHHEYRWEIKKAEVEQVWANHENELAALTAQLEALTKDRNELNNLLWKDHNKTCLHHSDEQRQGAGCPVCRKAELEGEQKRIKGLEASNREYVAQIAVLEKELAIFQNHRHALECAKEMAMKGNK